MKELQEAIINKKPLKVYLKDGDGWYCLGIWKYVENKNIYQGQFGYLDYENIVLCSMGKLEHIKLEIGE